MRVCFALKGKIAPKKLKQDATYGFQKKKCYSKGNQDT